MKIRKVKNAVGLVGNIVADMNATGVNDVPNTSTIKRYVDSKTIGEGSTVVYTDTAPVGTIRLFGREDLPEGWLPCNGAAYLKTEYASLYEAINVTFNRIDDDPRYFRVPDLSGKIPVGYGGDGEFSLGNTGGEKEHTLTENEIPPLATYAPSQTTGGNMAYLTNWNGYTGSGLGTTPITKTKATNAEAHNNMQPYVVVKYAIKAVDSTPTHGTIIDSMIGESTINAPSVNAVKNYVDKKQTYSTDEIVIGTYLGKPLYRKVLTGTLPTGKGENSFNLPSECSIKTKYGRIKSTLGGIFDLDTYYVPAIAYSISSWIAADEHTLKVECGANYNKSSKYEITVEYTKTTDGGA